MGYEDARLVLWLRKRFTGNPARRAKVDAIVKEAANKGTMSAMDSARDSLFSLVLRLLSHGIELLPYQIRQILACVKTRYGEIRITL